MPATRQARETWHFFNELSKLIENKESGVTYRISNEYFYIVFELDKLPTEVSYKKDGDTTLAIDMNPNYIGLSIVRNEEVIFKKCYDCP